MSKGIGAVNDALFRELERLEAVKLENPEAVRCEIGRAKAVEGIATTVIANGRLVLDIARAGTDVGEAVRLPKGLLGE